MEGVHLESLALPPLAGCVDCTSQRRGGPWRLPACSIFARSESLSLW